MYELSRVLASMREPNGLDTLTSLLTCAACASLLVTVYVAQSLIVSLRDFLCKAQDPPVGGRL